VPSHAFAAWQVEVGKERALHNRQRIVREESIFFTALIAIKARKEGFFPTFIC
jgi:hypothetical protein